MSDVQQGYFSELNEVITKIIEILKKDSELCKLINYDDSKPLSQDDFNHSDLIFTKIFPLPKQPDAQLSKGTILNIYFGDAKRQNKNSGFKEELIVFDIMCHLDSWKISSGIRPYSISSRIDLLFNDKKINDISDTNILFNGWTNIKYSDYWYGFRLTYRLSHNSNITYVNGLKV